MHPIWRACKRAGLRPISRHVLRHTFASHLVMRGVPLKAVQELMGHATIEMTMRYAVVGQNIGRHAGRWSPVKRACVAMSLLLALLGTLRAALKVRADLVLENLALPQQLALLRRRSKRPRVGLLDRVFWMWLSQWWVRWREALHVVQPQTVIRWHRQGFRAFWNWKSRRGRTGRPPVDLEIAKLVRTMALANPLWGAPRIHGELLKLGLDVSQRTVGRLMPRCAKPPSQTWRTFLENHVADLVSVDFFVVPTATFRVLYVFVVLLHHRRRVVHFNVTDSPTAAWTAQQIVEAFPDDSAPHYLLRDRDSIYGGEFRRRVKGMCIAEVLSSPRSPWQNPFAERVIGTLRRELLDHVIVLSEAQAVGSSSGSVRLPIAGSSTHPSAQAGGGVPQNPSLLRQSVRSRVPSG